MNIDKIIAHRGAKRVAPENTLSAFRMAKKLGAHWIECDVMLTQDNVPIIHHDPTLLHATGRDVPVHQVTYADLQNWPATYGIAKFPDERIPSLTAALHCFEENQLSVHLEIKPLKNQDVQTVDRALELLLAQGYLTPDNCILSSASSTSIKRLQEIAPQFLIGFIVSKAEQLMELPPGPLFSLHCYHALLTQACVDSLKKKGYRVGAYTVNDKALALQLFNRGVDFIFSDEPELLK